MNQTDKKTKKAVDYMLVAQDILSFLNKRNLLDTYKECFLSLFILYFYSAQASLPQENFRTLYLEAWKTIKQFSAKDIECLSEEQKLEWCYIFRICYRQQPFYKRWI